MKTFRRSLITVVALAATFVIVFVALGWLAPHNMAINRFYSSTFYSLRVFKESSYLNRLERHDGVLRFSVSGEPSVQKDKHSGIGFEIPDGLRDIVAAIPDGTEVTAYIGRRLDRESVGIYHYELRKIERK